MNPLSIFVVMGVSGCGKTTLGQYLAKRLEFVFFDADSFHSASNIGKMQDGIPLDDQDRLLWLQAIYRQLASQPHSKRGVVLACSALKLKYRNVLRGTFSDYEKIIEGYDNHQLELVFIYLKGSYQEILERIQNRIGHFMPPELLLSQFDILEEPTEEECNRYNDHQLIVIPVQYTLEEATNEILKIYNAVVI